MPTDLPAPPAAPTASVKSADRTVDLLELLSRTSEPLTLSEIQRALSYPKSSLFVLLRTLVARGWVETDRRGTGYSIGVRALLVGTSYLDRDPVIRAATRTSRNCAPRSTRRCTSRGSTAPTWSIWPAASPRTNCGSPPESAVGCPRTRPPWGRRCWPPAPTPRSTRSCRPSSTPSPRAPSPNATPCWPTSPRPESAAMRWSVARTPPGSAASPWRWTTSTRRSRRSAAPSPLCGSTTPSTRRQVVEAVVRHAKELSAILRTAA